MPRSHRDVRHPEVEEPVGGRSRFQPVKAAKVVGERRLQRVIQQVLDREVFGVVGPAGLPRARCIVEVDGALFDHDPRLALGRKVGLRLRVDGQI